MTGGLRFSGTVELAGIGAAPDWRRAHILLAQGLRMLPGLVQPVAEDRISVWMGHRPSMPDSLPVIGPVRHVRNVFYAFGHGHTGLTGAAKTAQIIGALIEGERPPIEIDAFSPNRFA